MVAVILFLRQGFQRSILGGFDTFGIPVGKDTVGVGKGCFANVVNGALIGQLDDGNVKMVGFKPSVDVILFFGAECPVINSKGAADQSFVFFSRSIAVDELFRFFIGVDFVFQHFVGDPLKGTEAAMLILNTVHEDQQQGFGGQVVIAVVRTQGLFFRGIEQAPELALRFVQKSGNIGITVVKLLHFLHSQVFPRAGPPNFGF